MSRLVGFALKFGLVNATGTLYNSCSAPVDSIPQWIVKISAIMCRCDHANHAKVWAPLFKLSVNVNASAGGG